MGIINLSQKSFSHLNKFNLEKSSKIESIHNLVKFAFHEAQAHLENGAKILDVGAVPSNPNIQNAYVKPDDELGLLMPVLKFLRKRIPSDILVSVDTYSPHVAYELAKADLVDIINDICGGERYEAIYHLGVLKKMSMMDVVKEFSLGYVLMHMFGTLETLPKTPNDDTLESCALKILNFFERKSKQLKDYDIDFCIFDPGVGGGRFGKNFEQNLMLISKDFINKIQKFGYPILVGLSRKSFLQQMSSNFKTPQWRDEISKELEMACLQSGVKIIRSHIVKG